MISAVTHLWMFSHRPVYIIYTLSSRSCTSQTRSCPSRLTAIMANRRNRCTSSGTVRKSSSRVKPSRSQAQGRTLRLFGTDLVRHAIIRRRSPRVIYCLILYRLLKPLVFVSPTSGGRKPIRKPSARSAAIVLHLAVGVTSRETSLSHRHRDSIPKLTRSLPALSICILRETPLNARTTQQSNWSWIFLPKLRKCLHSDLYFSLSIHYINLFSYFTQHHCPFDTYTRRNPKCSGSCSVNACFHRKL